MGQAKEANDLGTRTRDKMCVGKLQKEEEEEETKLLYFLKLRKKKTYKTVPNRKQKHETIFKENT